MLLNKMGEKKVTIGVDGSVYRYHPHFHNLMMEKIRELALPDIDVRITIFHIFLNEWCFQNKIVNLLNVNFYGNQDWKILYFISKYLENYRSKNPRDYLLNTRSYHNNII